METCQRDQTDNSSHSASQDEQTSPQGPDYFAFLRTDGKKHLESPPFFSKNGLGQDIIQVTGAEPDICLEVFYALYNTLWPQIEKLSDTLFKDAWTNFIGVSVIKGSLCPPEKLITEKKVRDIISIMSESGGENRIFQDLDCVINSVSDLEKKVTNYPGQILKKEEIIESLSLVHGFYLEFRNKMKLLVEGFLKKKEMSVSQYGALEDLLEQKAVMMSDSFSQHWAYRIPRNRAQRILSFDANGRSLESNLSDPSNHRVISLPEKVPEPLVYFKANGNPQIQPEKEFMLYSLYRHLQIPVPETSLLILTDVFETNSEYFYAVQASEAVTGESSLQACQDPETILEQETYVSQAIGAFLTNPSDGSFKNFKYSPDYKALISIDNDLVFKPELTGEENKKTINVKSILYLLPQIDHPIPKSTKTFFTTLDPYLTILSWLQDLSQKNKKYQLLFEKLAFQRARCTYQNLPLQDSPPSLKDKTQKKVQVDSELHNGSFYPQILVSKNLVESLAQKLQKIKETLSNPGSTSTQVLFEQVSPVLGKYYQRLKTLFTDPKIAQNALWRNKMNGVDYSFILSLLTPQEISSLALKSLLDQSENKESFPEDFFKDCKDKLALEEIPFDCFIRRHSQRKKENLLNLQEVLKELRLLAKEGLTSSQYPRDVVDFYESLSRIVDCDLGLFKEITSLFSNLPHTELRWLLTLEKYFIRPEREQYLPKGFTSSYISVFGAFMKQRQFMLTESEKHYIFDSQGDLKSHPSLTGRSNVTYFPEQTPEFYLKQYPELPGYELACTVFMRLLGVRHLPYQDLIIINSPSKDNSYPVLLTQKVNGDPVHKVWHNSKVFHSLDPLHTGLLIIAAMLLNPEDGKEDNFIFSQDGKYLIPIDNDHCFLPSTFQKEGNIWNRWAANTALQTKTLLFCLDEMVKPIPHEVKESLLEINWDLFLPKWMTELVRVEDRFENLVDSDQQSRFREHGTVTKMTFYKQFINHLHWKAHKITTILNTTSNPTPFDLLKAIEPFAAKCYRDSFHEGDTLERRFKAATHLLYTKTLIGGSRVSILDTRAIMEIINVSEKDLLNEVFFQKMGPVTALDLLNQLIQEQKDKIKIEQELLCELDEKNQEKKWYHLFGGSQVEADLKVFFANPKEGLALKGSKLVISRKLTNLFALTPDREGGMRIRFLSLPESPFLTEKEIKILAQECPNLEYLDVSRCIKLEEIITAEGEWPLLARVEARGCLSLERFASFSPLKTLRIETQSSIDILVEKPTLDIFVISTKINQFELLLRKGEDFQIKFQGETKSKEAFFLELLHGNEEIEQPFRDLKITIEKHSILSGRDLGVFVTALNFQSLNVNSEDIQRLMTLKLINLKWLDLSRISLEIYALEYISRGDFPKLSHLNLSHNDIKDLGINIMSQGNWPLLESLNLQNTRITTTGVKRIINQAKWIELKHLNLSENHIDDEALEILPEGNWPLLETLDIRLTDISKKGALNFKSLKLNWPKKRQIVFSFWIQFYGKESIQMEKENSQIKFDLSSSQLTKSEIGIFIRWCGCIKLIDLDISKNEISVEGLSILCRGNWTILETMNLRETTLTNAGVKVLVTQAKWVQLKHLDLSQNPIGDEGLKILAAGNWPRLETLDLRFTDISKKGSLNFKSLELNWPKIRRILFPFWVTHYGEECYDNKDQLRELDMSSAQLTKNEMRLLTEYFCHLNHLNLSKNEISVKGLSILCRGNWTILKTMNLRETALTNAGVEILVARAKWTQLRHLDLSQNPIGDEGLEILPEGNWPLLETLNLSSTDITRKGALSFYTLKLDWPKKRRIEFSFWIQFYGKECCDNKDRLSELDMSSAQLTKNEIKILIENFYELNYLNLSKNVVSVRGLSILCRGNWASLKTLNLRETALTNAGVEILVAQAKWTQLRHLDLSQNPIDDEGLEILPEGNWPLLEILNLRSTEITKKGALNFVLKLNWSNIKEIKCDLSRRNFIASLLPKNWHLLEELDLSWGKLTQNEIKVIVKKMGFPQLKTLDLSGNEVIFSKDGGLASGNWPLLECLKLYEVPLTQNDIKTLIKKASWPNLKEIHLYIRYHRNEEKVRRLVLERWPKVKVII